MMKRLFWYVLTFILLASYPLFCAGEESVDLDNKMVIVSAADSRFYRKLLNLIGSLHHVNFEEIHEIAVFDLGLKPWQRKELENICKVQVYDVELTHPQLLSFFLTKENGQLKRGWYAWKPVLLKQILDRYPTVLYLDSAALALQSLKPLYEYIQNEGYFFVSCGHSIKAMTTQKAIDYFDLNHPSRQWILDKSLHGNMSGCMGLTRSLYTDIIYPAYQTSKDIELFADDGTAPGPTHETPQFGYARHDQMVLSIMARLYHKKVYIPDGVGNMRLIPGNKPIQITQHFAQVTPETTIYICAGNFYDHYFTHSIRFKKPLNTVGLYLKGKAYQTWYDLTKKAGFSYQY